jgi:hypothetical protein
MKLKKIKAPVRIMTALMCTLLILGFVAPSWAAGPPDPRSNCKGHSPGWTHIYWVGDGSTAGKLGSYYAVWSMSYENASVASNWRWTNRSSFGGVTTNDSPLFGGSLYVSLIVYDSSGTRVGAQTWNTPLNWNKSANLGDTYIKYGNNLWCFCMTLTATKTAPCSGKVTVKFE